ncbi:MAG: HlyC/CorC family transporter, partial [Synergistaceae bacterium]|nr:HlyC/CorC family transporter [Synergistaceae bacterium]
LSETLNYEFSPEEDDQTVESIGGLVLLLSGSFPKEGDVFEYKDWKIKVLGLEEHRIKLLNLSRDN